MQTSKRQGVIQSKPSITKKTPNRTGSGGQPTTLFHCSLDEWLDFGPNCIAGDIRRKPNRNSQLRTGAAFKNVRSCDAHVEFDSDIWAKCPVAWQPVEKGNRSAEARAKDVAKADELGSEILLFSTGSEIRRSRFRLLFSTGCAVSGSRFVRVEAAREFFFPLIEQGPIDGTRSKVGHVLVLGQPVDRLLE